tara:strand:- start:3234 stop:3503 length:270 start_codon:yes stop_codon:yes gene_type:complete
MNEKVKKLIDEKTLIMKNMREEKERLEWQIEELENDIREIYKDAISEIYQIDYEQMEEWERGNSGVIDMYITEMNERAEYMTMKMKEGN